MRGTDKIVESARGLADFISGYQEKCEWTRPFAACDIFVGFSVLFVRRQTLKFRSGIVMRECVGRAFHLAQRT